MNWDRFGLWVFLFLNAFFVVLNISLLAAGYEPSLLQGIALLANSGASGYIIGILWRTR